MLIGIRKLNCEYTNAASAEHARNSSSTGRLKRTDSADSPSFASFSYPPFVSSRTLVMSFTKKKISTVDESVDRPVMRNASFRWFSNSSPPSVGASTSPRLPPR